MSATCPACSWSEPALVSAHGTVRYLRCVCGKWLIQDSEVVLATAGSSAFGDAHGETRSGAGEFN
ncbi:hypothetical protein [Nocardia crassostreae]|uniref:hypothetical protein n=1 Tax=Nocardia crassostreae TaxID=53428 RepID=UPI000A03FE73|nr:hypothetical protein [Nocardia crassostreae]